MTFEEMRADFVVRRKGALALPITGVIAYSLAALLSLVVDPRFHNLALTLCFWSIMPLGLMIGRMRGEDMSTPAENPLLRLSAMARTMALATWSVHIPIWAYAPDLFPISVGIGFALHWVVFGWTLGHPVGWFISGCGSFSSCRPGTFVPPTGWAQSAPALRWPMRSRSSS